MTEKKIQKFVSRLRETVKSSVTKFSEFKSDFNDNTIILPTDGLGTTDKFVIKRGDKVKVDIIETFNTLLEIDPASRPFIEISNSKTTNTFRAGNIPRKIFVEGPDGKEILRFKLVKREFNNGLVRLGYFDLKEKSFLDPAGLELDLSVRRKIDDGGLVAKKSDINLTKKS